MAIVTLDLPGGGYDVHVGHDLLQGIGHHAGGLLSERLVCVVADREARRLHGERLAKGLNAAGREPVWLEIAGGEASKSWSELERVTEWLLDQQVEREDSVIALGGGVVGDLVGLASAICKRGCRFIQLPTTLLAQVDSSVGGKTAINARAGKNLVGAFHQPALVLADLGCLSTLPARELRAGYAEIVKYAALGDRDFFEWLEAHGDEVIALEDAAIERAVAVSVAGKARIVMEDERETRGRRALLNLGHTFGHALEAATGYSHRLLHGEAVALGMVLAARYSARRGELPHAEVRRVEQVLDRAGLPVALAGLDIDADGTTLVAHMRHDKKVSRGVLPFVLLRAIGDAYLAKDVALGDVAAFLDGELD